MTHNLLLSPTTHYLFHYLLSGPSGESLAGSAIVRIVSDILGALGKPDFTKRIRRAFETLNELVEAPNFARTFEIVFRYRLADRFAWCQ